MTSRTPAIGPIRLCLNDYEKLSALALKKRMSITMTVKMIIAENIDAFWERDKSQ